jgi:hypothetical protein
MAGRSTAFLALAGVLIAAGLFAGWGVLTGLGSGRGGDCRLSKLERDGPSIPVRAECDWPIPTDRLLAMLESWEAHALYFGNLRESAVLGFEGDSVIVRQLHQAAGISDREVVVEWNVTPLETGRRYSWHKSPDQSAATGRGVEAEDYEGSWEITSTETGSHLVLELRYAPGGRVPFFLVRWFQGSGIRQVLSELRSAAESEVQVASGPPS